MNDKTLELAKKIKALADRGYKGEKDAAIKALNKLMERYNISLEELEDEKIEKQILDFTLATEQIMVQIISMIMGSKTDIWHIRGYKTKYSVECSKAEFIEIQSAYNFYSKEYNKDLKIFIKAWIHKHKLYAKDSSRNLSELTKAEREEHFKTETMAQGIERKQHKKQLERSNTNT